MHHLYIHVPFCARRCSYCDFSIAVRRRVPADEYISAVRLELGGGDPIGPLETIYFGGGTPSLLPPASIATLLQHVLHHTSSPYVVEVTLEANPEDVTPEAARSWRDAGVNRVSLGAQSFDDRVLRWMHRVHDAARSREAVGTLRAAGFDNVSLDLIFAVPAVLERDWARDLAEAVALSPDHLSLYGLTVEPRTPLARWIARGGGATSAPADDRYAEEYLLAHERLGAAGYAFYEVSNAARDGRRSRHNSAYWTGRAYSGLGPAAHSFDGHARRWNLSAWEAYRRAIAAGRSPVEAEEVLTAQQRQMERLYLGLRTEAGVPVTALQRPSPHFTALMRNGWLIEHSGRVQCTVEGWLRLDALVATLTGTSRAS